MSKRSSIDKALFGTGLLGDSLAPQRSGGLSTKFMVPPFTILNAREGWWQDRKRAWLSLGIQSEVGRGEVSEAEEALPLPDSGVSAPEEPATPPEQAPEPIAAVAKPKPRAPAPKPTGKRFAAPTIVVEDVAAEEAPAQQRKSLPEPALMREAKKYGKKRIEFNDYWEMPCTDPVGMDVECYANFFLVCFENFKTGQRRTYELSERCELDLAGLQYTIENNRIVTYNGLSYDVPMIYMALALRGNNELKLASDRIILTKIKYWEVEKEFKIKIPSRLDHIDMSGSNPSVKRSLKEMGGRLHRKLVMDLPYPPDTYLTHEQMNVTTLYCFNDIDHTKGMHIAQAEPLELRRLLSNQYKRDLRSKSDAQVGEAIVKAEVEKLTGNRIGRDHGEPMSEFGYRVPEFVTFENKQLREVIARLGTARFYLNGYGVTMPEWLKNTRIAIGSSSYTMGIGGLHSNEENRAVLADAEHHLYDLDVASQYPSIIRKLGLYPKAMGPKFLDVYSKLIDQRLASKDRVKEITDQLKTGVGDAVALADEKVKETVKVEGGKIALNGVYGKLGNEYSALNAPDIMIAVTLTGQLSLLMLIERFEAAGISVVSGNTDGVVARCPKVLDGKLAEIVKGWEDETGFKVEQASYKAIYNSSVNTYIAIKDDGKVKRKGPVANPWSEGDLRGQLSKNPQMTVLSDAVVAFVKDKVPLEDTIRACKDVRQFITTIKVEGGATWRGIYLGRVARYYWSTDNDPIQYVKATASGGSRRVAKTNGARPMMELLEELPEDIDYARYIAEAEAMAIDLGAMPDKKRMKV